ncbi:MAG: hypothetical protein WCS31_01915 [Verrucomicrobiae bacterium]
MKQPDKPTRQKPERPPRPSTALAKIQKAAARLADCVSAEDTHRAASTIRSAMAAEHRVYDPEQKKLISFPDHKTRLAAAQLFLTHVEGMPVQKAEIVSVNIDGRREAEERIFRSPALLAAMRARLESAERCVGGNAVEQPHRAVTRTPVTQPQPSAP